MQCFPNTWLKFLWYFIRQQPISFTLLLLAPCTLIVENTILPYAFKLIVDAIVDSDGNRLSFDISFALWLGGGSFLLLCTVMHLQHWLQVYAFPKFKANIRISVLEFTMQHSYQYFYNNLAGDLGNKINDLQRYTMYILETIRWSITPVVATVMFATIMINMIQPIFALILFVWIALHISYILLLAPYVNRTAAHNAEDDSQINGSIIDMFNNIMSVKLFANRRYNLGFVNNKQQQEMRSHARLINKMRIFNFSMDVFIITMFIITTYLLVTYWQQNQITAGDFTFIFQVFMIMVERMWALSSRLIDLFKNIGTVQQAIKLINRPYDLVDAKDAKLLLVANGQIAFDGVSFAYYQGQNIFTEQSLNIEPGTKVGLVGFSGSGKTTFINLILRFFDINSGKITIDGQDISQVTQDSLHNSIVVIPQDTMLFHCSLMDNIRYGNVQASDEEVIAAARKAHCHEFITTLPAGYDSLVGERGVKLSGGQRQRIAIARAILKDAPILIMDEATSALDSVTEKHIYHSMDELMHGKTAIIIAHRLSTLANMDRILVFNEGSIIEDGNHEELLLKVGYYAKMWRMQMHGFLPEIPSQSSVY